MGEKQAPDAFPREAAAVKWTGFGQKLQFAKKQEGNKTKRKQQLSPFQRQDPLAGRVKRETRGQGTLPNQPAAQKTRRRTRKFPPFIKKGGTVEKKNTPSPPLFKGPEEFSTYSIPSAVFSSRTTPFLQLLAQDIKERLRRRSDADAQPTPDH